MLTETVFRTADVPAPDRFDAWRECMGSVMAPMDITSSHASDFMADQRLTRLGAVSVWPVTMHPSRYRRTRKLVRQSDPELYHLTLVLPGSATLGVAHEDRRTTHRAHDLYLLDSSRPYDVGTGEEQALIVGVGVEIPKALLPLSGKDRLDPLLGRRLSGRDGFGALLVQFLTRLATGGDTYRAADAPRLCDVLLDLIAGLLANELDGDAVPSASSRDRATILRVRDHVQRHLHDPQLSPQTVAAAHHLSIRQLHRLFEAEDVSVAGLIRERRLERVRRDLADPATAGTPVQAVAARWGFTSPAHFSRVFRAAYGVTPGEYRHSAAG